MQNKKPGLFKLLGIIIMILVCVLIVTNLLYIKYAWTSRHCATTNILTIILLLWATAFWFVVMKHSDRK